MLSRKLIIAISAQLLKYAANILALPFILVTLPPEQVGLWYLLVGIQGVVLILDFGFNPTFSRNFSLAHKGAEKILSDGISNSAKSTNKVNTNLLNTLLASSKTIYAFIALLSFLVLLTVDNFYLTPHILHKSSKHIENYWLYIFYFSVCLNVYFSWSNSLLIGVDKIERNYVGVIIQSLTFLTLAAIGLNIAKDIYVLIFSYFTSIIISRIYYYICVKCYLIENECFYAKVDYAVQKSCLKTMLPNVVRTFSVSLGTFLCGRYVLFLIASSYGLALSASYSITFQLISTVVAFSQIPMQISLARLVSARVEKNNLTLKKIITENFILYWVFSLSGTFILLVFGRDILGFIDSNVNLLDENLMIYISILLVLEGNHAIFAFVITSNNNVPFVTATILTGLTIAVGTTIISLYNYPIAFIFIFQFVSQALYNNWRWPLYVYKDVWLDKKVVRNENFN